MLVLVLTILASGVLGERFNGVKKAKCTSDADCTGGLKCDLTLAKVVKGTKYGMCRDTSCTNAEGDDYCTEFGKGDYCNFDTHRRSYGNDYDLAGLFDGYCQQACDPHCFGSAPLVLERGQHQRLGRAGEFCTHHIECEGTHLCDYTQNTVKIGGYTMGVCRKSDCKQNYGFGPWYDCSQEKADPQMCGPNHNYRWDSCPVTCDPMCYGAPVNKNFRSRLDKSGLGVDRTLVTMHTEAPTTSMIVQAFAVFGLAVTAYGAGKFYLSK